MLKAIIIDDEIQSISILTQILENKNLEVEVIGKAMNVADGITLIQKTKIDLLFLDIEMPDGTGFDLLDALEEINFDIIFITAFNQYAIKAFRYAALDYLMKPINPTEIDEAISRVKTFKNKDVSKQVNLLLENHKAEKQFEKLAVATTEGVYYYDVSQIFHCKADGSYTTIFAEERKPIVASKSIKEYESILPSFFFRVHKSHLVNLNFIKEIHKGEQSELILKNDSKIQISRRRKQSLLDNFSSLK